MSYSVKECFLTLQGEGARTGRAAVLCRMSGCNLWTGRDEDRDGAVCRFCDTDFKGTDGPGGGRFESADLLAAHIEDTWKARAGDRPGPRYVVFTGGEPLLQLDASLVQQCHGLGFEVGLETNGTLLAPAGVDWICVSPKAIDSLVLRTGHELKLVHPQPGLEPQAFEHLAFEHFYLQPMDGPLRDHHTRQCVDYCLSHPRWRLSAQVHKLIGVR